MDSFDSRARRVAFLYLVLGLCAGCGPDHADQEYIAALRGQESGMAREEQIAHVSRAIALAPRRASYYETRAGYWIGVGDYDRAFSDMNKSIELAPRPYAYFYRGMALCQVGAFERAIQDFDIAIQRHPENTQFYRGRSLARAATGNALGALEDAKHLVKVVPQQAESYHARGVALGLLQRDREAVRDFDRAAEIRPELVYVIEARTAALERLGETDRAAADRETADRLRAEKSGCPSCLDPFR
jgi:tetratricopeptide (TPR) repeat protein